MNISVIGGGSWGTALAGYLSGIGHDIRLWALESEVVNEINSKHTNETFLAGAILPESLRATNSLAEALADTTYVLSVVPTQFLRSVVERMKNYIVSGTTIISASKGIENKTLLTPVEIYRDCLPGNLDFAVAALAGPSFAKEVIRNHPTAVVLACEQDDTAVEVQNHFSSDIMRIYTSYDIVGVELCGAVKNVIALASGAVAGLGFGDNTRAALITRGITEISRLVKAMGGNRRTVAGMAGLGDMVLTCTSSTSRNYTVGYRLGSGEKLEDITASMKMIAEGVNTTKSVASLAEREGVDLPISLAMYDVLYNNLSPVDAVRRLMTRELKHEWEADEL
jgi:glycerol-3-phosphate dehydrogenase (NAD(P)+)